MTYQTRMISISQKDRDGMALELDLIEGDKQITIAEVFYSEEDGTYTFSIYEKTLNIPLEVIQDFIEQAKVKLPFKNKG